MYPHTKFRIPTSNDIGDYTLDTIILETRPEVEVTVTKKMTCKNLPSQDAYKYQIWDSYYKIIALNTIILETRTEVKVTVTRKWFPTLRPPMMHPYIKFGIPTSNNNWASSRENQSWEVCEQQWRIPACASAQSDQRLFIRCLESTISKLATSVISIF